MDNSAKRGCECSMPDVTVYPSLAMVYPPRQVWRNLYDPDVGLERGTIFCELDMPFSGDNGKKGE